MDNSATNRGVLILAESLKANRISTFGSLELIESGQTTVNASYCMLNIADENGRLIFLHDIDTIISNSTLTHNTFKGQTYT